MNSDSFIVYRSDYPSGHPFQTQTLALTTTAEQLFQITGTNTAIVTVPSQTGIYGSMAPFDPNTAGTLTGWPTGMRPSGPNARPGFTSTSFSGRGMRVRAMGVFNNQAATTNAQTITFRIRLGTTAGATICSTVASGTNTSATGNWIAESTVMWDATSTYALPSEYWGAIGAQTGSAFQARTSTGLGSVAVAAYTSLQFVATCQVSTSNATSTAQLVEFSMEAI